MHENKISRWYQVLFIFGLLFLGFKCLLVPILDYHAHVVFDAPFILVKKLFQPSNNHRLLGASSCGAEIHTKALRLTKSSKSSLAVSINSSKLTSYRLCNLIAFLEAQAKSWEINIDITVFSDAELSAEELCGNATVIVWETRSNHDRYFTRVRPLWERYRANGNGSEPGFGWVVLLDDDSLVFLPTLQHFLQAHDPGLPLLLGGPSESTQSIATFGHIPYGGAGMVLSLAALASLQPVLDCCRASLQTVFGGDEKLARCVGDLGATVVISPAFHQMDVRGNLSGYLEGVASREPVISLHHLYIPENIVFPAPPVMPAEDATRRGVKQLALSYSSLGPQAASKFCQSKVFYAQVQPPHEHHHGAVGQEKDKEKGSQWWRAHHRENNNNKHSHFTVQWTIGYSLVLYESFMPFSKLLYHVDATFALWQPTDAAHFSLRTMQHDKAFLPQAFQRYYLSCRDSYCLARYDQLAPCESEATLAFVCDHPTNLRQALSTLHNHHQSPEMFWGKHVYSVLEGEQGISVFAGVSEPPEQTEGSESDASEYTTGALDEQNQHRKKTRSWKKISKVIVDIECEALLSLKKHRTIPFHVPLSSSHFPAKVSSECIQFVMN